MRNRNIPDNPTLLARAAKIGEMPASSKKVEEARELAHLAVEGFVGPGFLQHFADTLTLALQGSPMPDKKGEPDPAYLELAALVRYTRVKTDLKDPKLGEANAVLAGREASFETTDFSLTDVGRRKYTLSGARGKILLVNFRDEACYFCRQELAYLNKIYATFKDKVAIFSITDATMMKVSKDLEWNGIAFPVLFDPDGKVYQQFHVYRQPTTLVFDAKGKLVAEAIGMQSGQRFLDLLAKAGLVQ